MRSFNNPELQKEYELERARELARADMLMESEDVRRKYREMNRQSFAFTIAPSIIMTCLILALEVISKIK